MSEKVAPEPLLPLSVPERQPAPEAADWEKHREYLFLQDQGQLMARLVPMYIEATIARALLESMASELGARMTAMDSATKNASEMISKLTLQYNRARQAAITTELMEIIGGAEALGQERRPRGATLAPPHCAKFALRVAPSDARRGGRFKTAVGAL